MPTKDQTVGVDDYYAHVNAPAQASSEEKKGGLKLKIKSKKPTEDGGDSSVAPVAAPVPVTEKPKADETVKAAPVKEEVSRPVFPTARVISRAADVQPSRPSGNAPRPNHGGNQ